MTGSIPKVSSKGYFAESETEYFYPELDGEPKAPLGAKVIMLNEGGVAFYACGCAPLAMLPWAPLPRRNKEKERLIKEQRQARRG